MMRITQMLRGAAQRKPGAMAVVSPAGSWTWDALLDRVARTAGVFAKLGVASGDRVAILAPNSHSFLEAFYAAPWAGAILVPINTRLSPEEIAETIRHSGTTLLLVDEACQPLWQRTEALLSVKPAQLSIGSAHCQLEDALINHPPIEDRSRGGDEIASLFYTGGTTGRSKGVTLTHANHLVNAMALWAAMGIGCVNLRYLHVAPMFHVADALFVHGITMVAGCHVIRPHFDPLETLRTITAESVTDLILVPTMVQALVEAAQDSSFDLPSLQRLHYGAAPMSEAIVTQVLRTWPHVGLVQLYGQTEAGPVVTLLNCADHNPPPDKQKRRRSAGLPLPGTEVAILDPEGRQVPVGEVGEVVVRSGSVMLGYWHDELQTDAALADGWLHTGDGGFLDGDGYLTISDRLKDMIISGGENIYSVEVERALALHPQVAQCAVVGLPDARWGERVHAVIVVRPGAALTAQMLVTHCRDHIAGFKCPRSFEFRSEPLPVSGAGKILKRLLRDEAIADSIND